MAERLRYVSPRLGTPIYAHLFDLAVTAALIAAAGFLYNTFTALYGAVVEAIIYYMVIGIAAVILATLRYSSFNISSKSRAVLIVFGLLMAGGNGIFNVRVPSLPADLGGW
ncbi:hypothetical protein [Vulcanisaeta distributa]|uniref:hypothetical protein n=1 Tax=Vulcanisaeta distributa TaxID=164451 RepID=UPI000ABA3A5C|nr:hypothetical protein [Vulcanisaeta distributa]